MNPIVSPQVEPPRACYFTGLEVEGVRAFAERSTLSLTGPDERPAMWTVLLGDNGVGKTTLLQCLALASRDVVKETERITPAYFRRVSASQFEIKVFSAPWHERGEAPEPCLFYQYPLQPDFAVSSGNNGIVYGYGISRHMSEAALSQQRDTDRCLTLFNENASLLNAEEWFLQAEFAARSSPNPWNLDRRDKVKQLLCEGLLPGVTDIRSAFRANQSASVEVRTADDGWIPMRQLSSGYKSVISWMTDLASRMLEQYPDSPEPLKQPAVVLVDQIDLYLHPKWQRSLMTKLREIFPRVQWIVTAHSPLIVQGMPGANLAVIRRENGGSVIDQSLPNIRGWRVDQLLSSELFDELPARDVETETLLAERRKLLSRSSLTQNDEARLEKIRGSLPAMDFGPMEEDPAVRDLMARVAAKLKVGA